MANKEYNVNGYKGANFVISIPEDKVSDESFIEKAVEDAYKTHQESKHSISGKGGHNLTVEHPNVNKAMNFVGGPIKDMGQMYANQGQPGSDERPAWRKVLGGLEDTAQGAIDELAVPGIVKAGVKGIPKLVRGVLGYMGGSRLGEAAANYMGAPPEVSRGAGMVAGGTAGLTTAGEAGHISPRVGDIARGAGEGFKTGMLEPVRRSGVRTVAPVATAAMGEWMGGRLGHPGAGLAAGVAYPGIIGAAKGAIDANALKSPWINPGLIPNASIVAPPSSQQVTSLQRNVSPDPGTEFNHWNAHRESVQLPVQPEVAPGNQPLGLPQGPRVITPEPPNTGYTHYEQTRGVAPVTFPPKALPEPSGAIPMPPAGTYEKTVASPAHTGDGTQVSGPTIPVQPPVKANAVQPPTSAQQMMAKVNTEPINESNWAKNRPVQPPVTTMKATPVEGAPKTSEVTPEGPVAVAPQKKLTWSKVQSYLENRKAGVSMSTLAKDLGASMEEAKSVLADMKEEGMTHNVGEYWKPGEPKTVTAPKKTAPAKATSSEPVIEDTPRKVEKPVKATDEAPKPNVSAQDMMRKVKSPGQASKEARLRALQDKEALTPEETKEILTLEKEFPNEEHESAKTKETKNAPNSITGDKQKSGETPAPKSLDKALVEQEPSWEPGKQITHDHLYKLANAIGVKPTQLARYMVEQGYDVQPSKFGSGSWGLVSGKKDLAKMIDFLKERE